MSTSCLNLGFSFFILNAKDSLTCFVYFKTKDSSGPFMSESQFFLVNLLYLYKEFNVQPFFLCNIDTPERDFGSLLIIDY